VKFEARNILAPTLIAAACTAILAYVNHRTRPVILEAARQKELQTVAVVLPAGLPVPVKTNLNETACHASFGPGGELLGVALEGVSFKGYGGEIRLLAGFTMDGLLHDFKILHAPGETPGLGTRIHSEAFHLPLRKRHVSAGWLLKQDGGDIDAITSATISSRAALEALRDAVEKFNHVKGKKGGD